MQTLKKRVALLLSVLMMVTLLVPGLPLGSVTAAAESTITTETFTGSDGAQHTVHVWTPASVAENNRFYPTLYLMPYDGYTPEQYLKDDIGTVLAKLMADDSVMDMIVVMPELKEGEDVHTAMTDIVTAVDKAYPTIASPDFRAVLGVDKGGYLAFEVGFYGASGTALRAPELFKAVGSHNGDFTSGNPWRTAIGHAMTSLSASNLTSFYTYIDACSTNPLAYAADGSNAVANTLSSGSLRSNYNLFEYTIRMPERYGKYTDAMARSLNRFSNVFGKAVVTASYTVGEHSITSDMETFPLSVNIDINETNLAAFATGSILTNYTGVALSAIDLRDPATLEPAVVDETPVAEPVEEEPVDEEPVEEPVDEEPVEEPEVETEEPVEEPVVETEEPVETADAAPQAEDKTNDLSLTVTWTMTDPDNGNAVLYTGSYTGVARDTKVERDLPAKSIAAGTSTGFDVTVTILGWTYSLGTDSLVRITDTIMEGSNQQLNLMGNWYFNPFRRNRTSTPVDLDKIDVLMNTNWKEWEVVQPGLGWWDANFSKTPGWGQYWTGYAWYVREFEVPEGFSSTNLLLALGMFDEADEAFINGEFVGQTGIPTLGGNYDGSNPWDVDRVYNIPDGLVKPGTNTIAVRMCNGSGGGGWYAGPIAIYSSSAYNMLKGLPYGDVDETTTKAVVDVVNAQNAALEANDAAAYLTTVSTDYFQGGYTRSTIWGPTLTTGKAIVDTNVQVFAGKTDSGTNLYMYQADRSVDGGASATVYLYFAEEDGAYRLYGDHARWYTTSIKNANGVPSTTASDKYHVYLPEDYFTSDERYPVTYMVHGINSTGLTFQIAGVPEILDAAAKAGEIRPTIVVFPDLTSSPSASSINTKVTGSIRTEIDKTLRTIPDRRYRGMAGESYGGNTVGAVYTANGAPVYSWEFDIYGIGSGSYPTSATLEFLQNYRTYMLAGNHDSYSFDKSHMAPSRALYQKGYDHVFEIENGEHSSSLYNLYVVDAFSYIMGGIKDVAQPEDSVITGTYETVEDTINWTATLSDYEKFVPTYVAATNATERTTGTLVVPVTISFTQNGKVMYSTTTLYDITSAEISGSVAIPTDYLTKDACYTVTGTASVLENNVTLFTYSTGHVYDEPEWTWSEDGKTASATFSCKTDDTVETVEATVTGEVTKAPTCEEKGTTTYTATVEFEGKTYTSTKDVVDVDAIGHKYELKGFTWSEDLESATATFVCANDESHTVTENATVTSKTTDPTELEDGKIVYTATVVFEGETYTDTKTVIIKATGHILLYVEAKEATCTEDGNVEYWVCLECGKYYVELNSLNDHFVGKEPEGDLVEVDPEAVVIKALGHVEGADWKSDATGHWHLCERCGERLSEAAHTSVTVPGVAPTETQSGWTSHEECSVCGYHITEAKSLPATGPATTIPATGDTFNTALWLFLLTVSASALAVVSFKKRTNR